MLFKIFFGEINGNPLQYYCLENPMDRVSLVGYSPWGRKESDKIARLHFHFLKLHIIMKVIYTYFRKLSKVKKYSTNSKYYTTQKQNLVNIAIFYFIDH